jgi:hypothetical protein
VVKHPRPKTKVLVRQQIVPNAKEILVSHYPTAAEILPGSSPIAEAQIKTSVGCINGVTVLGEKPGDFSAFFFVLRRGATGYEEGVLGLKQVVVSLAVTTNRLLDLNCQAIAPQVKNRLVQLRNIYSRLREKENLFDQRAFVRSVRSQIMAANKSQNLPNVICATRLYLRTGWPILELKCPSAATDVRNPSLPAVG